MVSFLCATPYHIIVSLYIMAGEFPEEKADLYLLDHFSISDEFISALKESGFYRHISVIHSDYKSKIGNIKRLFRAFFPYKVMKNAFKNSEYDYVFFGALDYVNMARWVKTAAKYNKNCNFALMEDGIGTYANVVTYQPKKYSEIILKFLRLKKYYNQINKVWCFKPQLRLTNLQYEAHAIARSDQAEARVQNAISKIWQIEKIDIPENAVLYLEQPYLFDDNNQMVIKEQNLLRQIGEKTGRPVYVKFHPRSTRRHLWKDFPQLDISVPFEAIMNRDELKNIKYLSAVSTAVVSPAIMGGGSACGIFLQKVLDIPEFRKNEEMLEQLTEIITQNGGNVTMPKTAEELIDLLN